MSQDLRRETAVSRRPFGMTRSTQNTDGRGVRRWGRISETMDADGPPSPGLGRGQGVYGSTLVASAMMS